MQYISTRGRAPALDFADAVMQGPAADGGLYLPQAYPQFSAAELTAMRDLPYAELAARIMQPFTGAYLSEAELRQITAAARQNFHHPAVCPLIQTGSREFVLELFHGPTLAFQDIAMQFLVRLTDYILAQRNARATIIGAAAGDMGGAAIEAFANQPRADIFILFPENRISAFQQWQMTCNSAPNVHAAAIDGDFDDCQAIVKALFNDQKFRADYALSAINSANWARIMAQIVCYFSAAFSLGAPARQVSFAAPAGDFSNMLAGFIAHKMGLPIKRLIIAGNDHDILARALETGTCKLRAPIAAAAPAADIQAPANFERLLFEASGRNAELCRRQSAELAAEGEIHLTDEQLTNIRRLFSAYRADGQQIETAIGDLWRSSAYLAAPHTAAALLAAADYAAQAGKAAPAANEYEPIVILATVHPAKFPQAVQRACGQLPKAPAWAPELDATQEKYRSLANNLAAVKAYIAENAAIKPPAGNAAAETKLQD